VVGNVHTERQPGATGLTHVFEKTLESGNAPGAADQPGVEADGHHGRVLIGLSPERIEGVDAVPGEVFGEHEIATGHVAHIVGIECVRHDHMTVAGHLDHMGQIVVIGIRIIKKPALLDEQPTGRTPAALWMLSTVLTMISRS
jgi:hypothetical protein